MGTLDVRKQNEIAIRAFKRVLQESRLDLQYILIGNGQERTYLEQVIISEGLTGKVIIIGQINDPAVLGTYYREAIATISYGQAGLAVLQSFAFGVPFVTKGNAISGGEKYNLRTGYNGYFCEDARELEGIMLRLASDLDLARKLGKNAYDYYSTHCSIENMASGFLQAMKSKGVHE